MLNRFLKTKKNIVRNHEFNSREIQMLVRFSVDFITYTINGQFLKDV